MSKVKRWLQLFFNEKSAMIGVTLLIILVGSSAIAPVVFPFNSMKEKKHAPLSAPQWMAMFDPYAFPDQIILDTSFKQASDINDFSVETTGDVSYDINFLWSGVGIDELGGAAAVEIEDKGTGSSLEGAAILTHVIDWGFHETPGWFSVDYVFKVEVEGADVSAIASNYSLFVGVFLKPHGMTGEDLYLYIIGEGVDIKETNDVFMIAGRFSVHSEYGLVLSHYGDAIRRGTQPDDAYVRSDLAPYFFAQPQQVDLSFVVVLRARTQDMRTGGIKVRVLLDNIYVKADSRYYGLMGTDYMGRDIAAMIFQGLLVSMTIGFIATLISVAIGVSVGIISGYVGGKVDELLMRFVDFLMAIPGLPLLMVFAKIFSEIGFSVKMSIVIVLSIFGWAGTARVIRSQVLAAKAAIYVEAAKAAGATSTWIMRKHILPVTLPLITMYVMTSIVSNILSEASLSFLGILTPDWPSLGLILQEASNIQLAGSGGGTGGAGGVLGAWWWVVFPGLILMLIGLGSYLVVDALNKVFNPKRTGY